MSGLFALRAIRGVEKSGVEELRGLNFDGQTVNFGIGDTITGGTSGAKGVLVEQTDAGATGTIILRNVTGDFVNNDVLTSSGTGDGDATGADFCPLLTPSDAAILQIDAVDMTKSEALELLRLMHSWIQRMDWPKAA